MILTNTEENDKKKVTKNIDGFKSVKKKKPRKFSFRNTFKNLTTDKVQEVEIDREFKNQKVPAPDSTLKKIETQKNLKKEKDNQNKKRKEGIKTTSKSIFLKFCLEIFLKTKKFCLKYSPYLVAIFISALSFFFFLTVSYFEFFSRNQFLNLRVYGIFSSVVIMLSTYLVSFLSKWGFWKSILVWVQSNFLILFAFAYFLNINNKNFHPLAITVLVFLIFLTILNLFSEKYFENLYLLFAKIFLFALTTFAYLEFLATNRIQSIEFNQELLAEFFNLSPLVWLVITAFAMSLFSTYSFQLKNWKSNLLYGFFFFSLTFQLLLSINSTILHNFFYWDKAILLAIIWNFLYTRIYTLAKLQPDSKFWAKTYLATGYHIFLILLVLGFSLFI